MSNTETKPGAAERIWIWASQLVESASAAKLDVQSGNYQHAVFELPAFIVRLSQETERLKAKGWDADVLGPVIFDLVDGDSARSWAADYATEYETFKTRLQEYFVLVVMDGAVQRHWGMVLDPNSGIPQYSVSPGTDVQNQLVAKLQEIVDSFPVVGG